MSRTVYQAAIEIGAKMQAGFQTATKGASAQLAELSGKVKGLEKTRTAIEGFERLNREVGVAEARSRTAKAEYERLGRQMDQTTKPSRELRDRFREAGQESRRADSALKRKRQTLERTGASLRASGVDTRRLTAEKARLGREVNRSSRRMAAMAAIAKANLGQNLRNLGQTIRRLGRTSTIVFGGMTAAMYKLADSTAKQGDSVAKTAQQLDMSTDAVQKYRYAAERGGMAAGEFDKSMKDMVTRIGEAAMRGGPAEKALRAIGLRSRDLVKIPTEQWVMKISDGLAGIKDPATRAAMAARLVGRSHGAQFANSLGRGSDELIRLGEAAERTGNVLRGKALRDAEEYMDAKLDMRMAIQGLRNEIGAKLMPVMIRVYRRVNRWVDQNRDKIKAWGEQFARWFEHKAIPGIIEFGKGLWKVAQAVGRMITRVKDMVGGWENFAKILGALALSKVAFQVGAVALSIFQIGKALVSLASLAIGHPIIALMAALAGATALILKYDVGGRLGVWAAKKMGHDYGPTTKHRSAQAQVEAEAKGMSPEQRAAWHDRQREMSRFRHRWSTEGMGSALQGVRERSGGGVIPKVPKDRQGPRTDINFHPRIEVKGGTASAEEVKGIVEKVGRDLLRVIDKAQKDEARLSYA